MPRLERLLFKNKLQQKLAAPTALGKIAVRKVHDRQMSDDPGSQPDLLGKYLAAIKQTPEWFQKKDVIGLTISTIHAGAGKAVSILLHCDFASHCPRSSALDPLCHQRCDYFLSHVQSGSLQMKPTDALMIMIDSTATTLKILLHNLCSHPKTMKRLRHELRESNISPPFDFLELNKLEYLDAVIRESMYGTLISYRDDQLIQTIGV